MVAHRQGGRGCAVHESVPTSDPAFLHVEQSGEVCVDFEHHADAGRLGAEVAHRNVFAHAVTDVSTPDHEECAVAVPALGGRRAMKTPA